MTNARLVAEEGDNVPKIMAKLIAQVKGDWSAKLMDGNLPCLNTTNADMVAIPRTTCSNPSG